MACTLESAQHLFAHIGRDFHRRGWVLGTSGNFSTVLSREPLRLAITRSGASKGAIRPDDVLVLGPSGEIVDGDGPGGRPSAETLLHTTLVRTRGAGAVLHTHSVWGTLWSELRAPDRGLEIGGFEMLKGLEGIQTHEHAEWIPILENDQDMSRLARLVEAELTEHPAAHAFLLRRHGLYTWGDDVAQATRHVEILEFLLEATARLQAAQPDAGFRVKPA